MKFIGLTAKIFIKIEDSKTSFAVFLDSLCILVKGKELKELMEASKENNLPVSCQEYADNGEHQDGSYRVQPDTNLSRNCFKT